MSIELRFKTAFAIVVIFVMALSIVDMFVAIGFGDLLFSPWFAAPAFLVAWLIAPLVSRRLPFNRHTNQ
jgi:hypothetical protein